MPERLTHEFEAEIRDRVADSNASQLDAELLLTELDAVRRERDLLHEVCGQPKAYSIENRMGIGWKLSNGATIKNVDGPNGIVWWCNRNGTDYPTALDAIRAALASEPGEKPNA